MDGQITVIFEDDGTPCNPLEREDPDITLTAEERDVGGLGILIVKKTMDSTEYSRERDCNIFTIRKNMLGRGGNKLKQVVVL